MRTDADDVQAICSAVGELSQRQNSRRSLGSGRVHGVQACPLTTAQTGIVVFDRPHVFDYCCLLWATLPPRLPTTAPAAPRNGVDDLSCTYLRLPRCLVRSSQPGGTRELTVCPSLACTLFPYSGAAKERAPAMPCISHAQLPYSPQPRNATVTSPKSESRRNRHTCIAIINTLDTTTAAKQHQIRAAPFRLKDQRAPSKSQELWICLRLLALLGMTSQASCHSSAGPRSCARLDIAVCSFCTAA